MKKAIAALALCVAAGSTHVYADGDYHEWNWGDVIATPADGMWWEVDTRTRGCSPMSTDALRDTERALIQAGITVSHGIPANDDGSRGASWAYMKGNASQVAFSRRADCEHIQSVLAQAQNRNPLCDQVAGIFRVTVALRNDGTTEADAYALVRKSGAKGDKAKLDNVIIKQLYEFPAFKGLSADDVVRKGYDDCVAMGE